MEHRWGLRRIVDVGVKVSDPSHESIRGRMLDASASGAYVATGARLPIMARVRIALEWGATGRGNHHHIPAYVVRTDVRGIGIEWQEFAPPSVLALLDSLEAIPARASRRAIRAITESNGAVPHPALIRAGSALGAPQAGASLPR